METIIVATDFSLPANNAVNYAVELSKYFSAKLILVNSFTLPAGGYGAMAPMQMTVDVREAHLQKLNALKDQIIKENYDFGVSCIVAAGNPSEVIEEISNNYKADLVVMGMTGEGGFMKKHLFGSSSLEVARKLMIPLFIIPEKVEYKKIENICFACDLSKVEETTLLHSARYFASIFNAEIELVSVEKSGKKENFSKDEIYSLVENRLRDTKHKLVYIKDDNVSQALEYYFKFHKTDVVMVNPKKHGLFENMFGESVTKKLAFTIQVPMLIVH